MVQSQYIELRTEYLLAAPIDINTVIMAFVYIVPLVTVIISIVTFTNAVKERNARTAAEAVSLKKDIENLSIEVRDLKKDIADAIKGYHNNDKRITTLEYEFNALNARVKGLESYHQTK